MKTDESRLNSAIKANNISKLYFLYGKETFLVKTYTDRIINKVLNEHDKDFNLIKMEGVPDANRLSDAIEGLPVFAEKKVVLLNDFDAEKTDADTLNMIIEILSGIPESTVVIINITGFEADVKKAKTKKLLTCAEKYGVTCDFALLSSAKTAELIIKKAGRAGVLISRENALYLSELTLRNLTLIGMETEKLCAYAGKGGEITAEAINTLVSKQLESNVFDLTATLTKGDAQSAFVMLSDLLQSGYAPVVILSSLSLTFVDFYYIKLGKTAGIVNEKIAADFNYAKNRSWVINKTAPAVKNVSLSYIKKCLELLNTADYKLKSSPVDGRVILEKILTEIITVKTIC